MRRRIWGRIERGEKRRDGEAKEEGREGNGASRKDRRQDHGNIIIISIIMTEMEQEKEKEKKR